MLILILLGAFKSGSDRFYLKRAIGERTDGRDVFYYFGLKRIAKMALFYLNLYLRRFTILLLCMLPFALCGGYLYFFIKSGTASLKLTALMLLTCGTFFILGTVFFFRFNAFLFLARYCFVLEKFTSNKQIFAFSQACMENNRRRLFKRRLNFVPWFATCVFLLPISFVKSYYNQSMAEFAAEYLQN